VLTNSCPPPHTQNTGSKRSNDILSYRERQPIRVECALLVAASLLCQRMKRIEKGHNLLNRLNPLTIFGLVSGLSG